ncbi:MAG: hypothetical protein RLZZ387_1305 [Chloroflexota bacterium]|jgi:subtilisin family serine protease
MGNSQGDRVILVAVALWVIPVALFGQAGVWLADQIAVITGAPRRWWDAPLGALVPCGLAALGVGALLPVARRPRASAVLRAWLLACVLAAVFAPLRALPASWSQPAMLLQAGLSLALAVLLARVTAAPPLSERAQGGAGALLVALGLGLASALPWLRLGALGSLLDTALAALAGVGFGALMGIFLSRWLFRPLLESGEPLGLTAGLAAGVALLLVAGGFGVAGGQVLLMLCLPPLGLAAVALARPNCGALPPAALLGVAAAAALALVDADELSLLLGLGDVPQVALGAALQSLLLGLALSGVLLAVWRRVQSLRAAPAAAALGLALVGAGEAYAGGQPGLYGDRLFVILREQPDLQPSSAPREARIAGVYGALTETAERTQADLRAELDRRGVAYTPYYLVNALEVSSDDPWLRAELAGRPEVERVLDAPLLRPLPEPAPQAAGGDPALEGPPWNITSIGADRVWRELGVTGAGIVVGHSDSGVDAGHPALGDGYRGRGGEDDYSWLDPWSGTASPVDRGGHGTHTLGTALGRGGVGVAPGAEWIGCVVLERNLGSPPRYLDCLQFMLAPYPRAGDPFRDGEPARAPHVLNNSWGCPPEEGCDAGALRPAVEALRAAGIFVVAAAGNEGPECSSVASPIAIYDATVAVGAVDRAGEAGSFSSRGPVTADGSGRVKPDIAAPGVDVVSAWPGGGYEAADGTSAASPHVAGTVALMWSANPALVGDIERTERILLETARRPPEAPVSCGAPGNVYGAGLLDAYAAVQAALAAP